MSIRYCDCTAGSLSKFDSRLNGFWDLKAAWRSASHFEEENTQIKADLKPKDLGKTHAQQW